MINDEIRSKNSEAKKVFMSAPGNEINPRHGQVVDYVLFGVAAESKSGLAREMIDNPDLVEIRGVILSHPALEEATLRPALLDEFEHRRAFSVVNSAVRFLLDAQGDLGALQRSIETAPWNEQPEQPSSNITPGSMALVGATA